MSSMEVDKDMLRKTIRQKIKGAGGFTAVARMLTPPISRQAVWQWGQDTDVPVARVEQVASILGMKPEELRPDLY